MSASSNPAKVALVVAVADNGVIGRDGKLPWHISSDLKQFRALTLGKPVVMGRKTFQSLKAPLAGRDNIVVTRDPGFRPAGVLQATSFKAALEVARQRAQARGVDEIMVIGGADIFRAAMPVAARIYLTRVHATPPGDTFFTLPATNNWREVSRQPLPRGPNDEYPATFVVLERVSEN